MKRKSLALIAASKLERFLMALGNLRDDDPKALFSFESRFREMLSDIPPAQEWFNTSEEASVRALEQYRDVRRHPHAAEIKATQTPNHSISLFGYDEQEIARLTRISELCTHVRGIWRGKTTDEKKLRALMLHTRVSSGGAHVFLVVPQITSELMPPQPFGQAILFLLENADRALVCGNPSCPAPLFFRQRSKRRQTYCSPECSVFGQQEAKRKWWSEHGENWRKQRGGSQSQNKKAKGEKHGAR